MLVVFSYKYYWQYAQKEHAFLCIVTKIKNFQKIVAFRRIMCYNTITTNGTDVPIMKGNKNMKATALCISQRYYVVGLDKPSRVIDNGKETYAKTYLYGMGGKNYKTLTNALKAISANGYEYIPANSINLVCEFD